MHRDCSEVQGARAYTVTANIGSEVQGVREYIINTVTSAFRTCRIVSWCASLPSNFFA